MVVVNAKLCVSSMFPEQKHIICANLLTEKAPCIIATCVTFLTNKYVWKSVQNSANNCTLRLRSTSLPMRRLCVYYGFDARWTRIASGQRLALDGHRRAIATSWLTCLFLAFRLPAVHASYELQAAGRWSLLRWVSKVSHFVWTRCPSLVRCCWYIDCDFVGRVVWQEGTISQGMAVSRDPVS